MSPLEPSNPTTAGLEYCDIAETQEKDLKTTFMNMTEVLNGEMNNLLKKSRKTQTEEENE